MLGAAGGVVGGLWSVVGARFLFESALHDIAAADRSFAALRMTGLAGIHRPVAIGCPCPSCAFCTTVILSEVEGSIHR